MCVDLSPFHWPELRTVVPPSDVLEETLLADQDLLMATATADEDRV